MQAAEARAEEGEDHVIAAPDGLSLFAKVWEPVLPVLGLPVICLHGLTRNSRDFEIVGPRLAALGRRAIALDVRGRGRSARDRDPTHYAAPTYVQDVLAVLDRLGIPKAVFLGTSMGGIITMATAATAPDRIAAAILNDVGPVLETAGFQRIGSYVGKNLEYENIAAAVAGVRAAQSASYPDRDDAFWRSFVRRVARVQPDGRVVLDYDPAIAGAFAAGGGAPDMTALFEALTVPVLVVRGAHSDLLSAEGVDLMRLVKSDLETVIVPNVGHAPTLEEKEAWDAIIDFLATVP